jgi:VWFA-related protein
MRFRAYLLVTSGALLLAQTPSFRATTRLIQVNVVVTDRHGDPVTALTKDKFEIIDQGRPQKIVFFSEQTGQPKSGAATTATPKGTPVSSDRPDQETGASGSATVILLDRLNTPFEDFAFARKRLLNFLSGVRPDDRIALYGLSGELVVLHDFTGDAAELVRALDQYSPAQSIEGTRTLSKKSNTGNPTLDAGVDDTNQVMSGLFMVDRVRQTAEAIKAIANGMAGLSGQKNLVWVSAGFPISLFYSQRNLIMIPGNSSYGSEVETAANALSNANVAVYPVDAHALATSRRPSVAQLQKPTSPELADTAGLATMGRLAEATGGKVFINSNDIEGAVRRALDDSAFTYTIGYYPDHGEWEGEFREVKVKVKEPRAVLRHRSGYLAVPESTLPATVTLADVVMRPHESSELGLWVDTERVGDRRVKLHIHIDASTMHLEKKDGKWTGALDVLSAQLGADAREVSGQWADAQFSALAGDLRRVGSRRAENTVDGNHRREGGRAPNCGSRSGDGSRGIGVYSDSGSAGTLVQLPLSRAVGGAALRGLDHPRVYDFNR